LTEADRLKDESLAILAHELGNLLYPVRSAVALLQKSTLPEVTLQWARDLIDRQVRQIGQLVDDLRDLSCITHNRVELPKERVELAAVVQSTVDTAAPFIEVGRHALTVTLPPQRLELHADPVRLVQVFSNLLINAAKYTDKGGHIEVSAERQGHEAVVMVKDDGIGIPAPMLTHIFEMFTQVDPSGQRSQGGLGIGLALARRLVEMHGGTIEARSAGPGKGSAFVVRLPLGDLPGVEPLSPG
jgi:signal transduction histidine kinase